MVKRKLTQSPKGSDYKIKSQRPSKRLRGYKISSIRISDDLSSKEEYDSCMDSNSSNLPDLCDTEADDFQYKSFSSFMKAFSFDVESDDEHQKFKHKSQNVSNKPRNDSNRGRSTKKDEEPILSSDESELEENTKIFSFPAKLMQIVLLEHPASLTLHGYVKVSVLLGKVSILGYKVREGENMKVFSTEGTGLKKVDSLHSGHKAFELTALKLRTMLGSEDFNVEEFFDLITSTTTVLLIKKIVAPPSLQFLELYYPNALQTKWSRSGTFENNKFELCSTEESYTIDINDDFKMLSKEINKIITREEDKTIRQSDDEDSIVLDDKRFGPRIIVFGEKNMGKSTLIRYLMNSALNKHPMFYFLDTDLGQTEYTPPGVISLIRVTKPLLGPPFAHQKKPLKMIYVGSISPVTSPELYRRSIISLMKYFNSNFRKETLFVNTMSLFQGLGELCLQNIVKSVEPTVTIYLKSPDPNLSLEKVVASDDINFVIPSNAPKESGVPSFSTKETRNFNIVAYLGQCQKIYMPATLINAIHPVCVSWDKIALYVMGKKVPPHRLVEAMHCSIVALCHVDLSFVLKSDNPELPMTLRDEPVCECLGFGLVRASDETNHLFYIVTPLTLDQLKNVNSLIKGNIMVPDQIILKQTIRNVPLPYTDHSRLAKTPGLKSVPRRAFRNTLTPVKKS